MADDVTERLLRYIEKSPSPYHCVAETAAQLEAADFVSVDERAEPSAIAAGSAAYIARGGSIVAWRAGTAPVAEAGFRLLGAHTDSPNLRVKPRPDKTAAGATCWGLEPYGGVLLATWLDRDLGVSGRVFVKNGDDQRAVLFRHDRPIARVPNLAIHLNRGVNEDGLILDKQKHLPAMVGGKDAPAFARWLEDTLGEGEVLSWDLGLHDVVAPTVGGLDDEFIFSPRLDNQASCFVSLAALLEAKATAATQVIVLFDHEEVGSRSASGAMSAFLRDVLARIVRDHEAQAKGGLERAIANSFLVSLDMAHGHHPNYADKHEPNHAPLLNGGPVIKEHVEQRYATDGDTTARFRRACARAEVPVQDFVIRSDLACGSTIGPISAGELGIATVDVGNPMLSMHSIREQGGAHDTAYLLKALGEVFAS